MRIIKNVGKIQCRLRVETPISVPTKINDFIEWLVCKYLYRLSFVKMAIPPEILIQRQGLPLNVKIKMTQRRIKEWYDAWGGNVYVAFSGGKDSTVLLDIVRKMYPNVPAVFVNTGLEYPEIVRFAKKFNNVKVLRPKLNFRKVIEIYGYPVISKKVSNQIRKIRMVPKDKMTATKNLYLTGYNRNGQYSSKWLLSKKWRYLLDAPFKISDQCCDYIKKYPFEQYVKKNEEYPINALMAYESNIRKINYLKTGCNAFDNKKPISTPMAFWTEQDILQYIIQNNLPYCSVYGQIIEREGILETTREKRTGCMFCMFGINFESYPNRFQRMKEYHPKHYKYCIEKLKIGEVLDYLNIPYK